MPSQFCVNLPVDTSTIKDRFNDPHSSTSGDSSRSFLVPSDSARPFQGDLRLVESTTSVQTIRPSYNPSSASNNKGSNSSKNSSRSAGGVMPESVGSSNGSQNAASSFKPQASQQQSASSNQQQYLHPIGYGDQRGGAAQKTPPTGEWHRRVGYQGRGQASDKGFAPAKMKQIYVAKPLASGPAPPG